MSELRAAAPVAKKALPQQSSAMQTPRTQIQ